MVRVLIFFGGTGDGTFKTGGGGVAVLGGSGVKIGGPSSAASPGLNFSDLDLDSFLIETTVGEPGLESELDI